MHTTIFDQNATRGLLPMGALVAELKQAIAALRDGQICCPERLVVPLGNQATLLSMPAIADDIAVHKLITVVPDNRAYGLPTIQGHLCVMCASTGVPLLMLDGPTVTGRRTAAMSMLGMHLLGPHAPSDILLVGTGIQAQHHVDAIADLHSGVRVWIRARSDAAATAFCARNTDRDIVMAPARPNIVPDVVITCTTSRTPVYQDPARRGCMIIAVGAFQPDAAEIDAATVLASRIFVDDPTGARHEAGDIILAGKSWDEVHPLADALSQTWVDGLPVLFKTVGCAAWDLAAARVALQM
ncbi:MAG: delta(1)-pyrroline-2-carboxylate reductase family protein [Burkholderiaceae bacterium]